MDPAAQIPQRVNPILSTSCVDARRLQSSPTPADPMSKVLNDDNLLIEIIVCLGFPNILVHAALVCKHWLSHASDPAFLRRFRKLHPPHLLGFYLDLRSLYLGYRPMRPCFIPMLPQPTELATVAHHVASYSLGAYHNVYIGGCQNSSILITGCSDGTYTFEAGASSLSRPIHFGEVISPLCSKRAVAIIPYPPCNRSMYEGFFQTDYTLFKQGGHDLYHLSLFEDTIQGGKNSAAHVYMLKDGVWCMISSIIAERPRVSWGVKPLLLDNKIYIPAALGDIVVFGFEDLKFLNNSAPRRGGV